MRIMFDDTYLVLGLDAPAPNVLCWYSYVNVCVREFVPERLTLTRQFIFIYKNRELRRRVRITENGTMIMATL